MNNFLKKTISFILVMIISAGIFISGDNFGVKGAEPIEIGYSISTESLYQGDTVEVKFFFKNFEEVNVDCTAFQLDVYVDPAIFSVGTMKCNLDGTDAMMYTTKLNESENKVKTIYFNTRSSLPKDSSDISTMTLTLKKDFAEITDVQLNITLAMALDADNNRFDVTYSSPVVKCLPLSEKPAEPTVTPPVSPSAAASTAPFVTSSAAPSVTDKPPETIPPTDVVPSATPVATESVNLPTATTDSYDAPVGTANSGSAPAVTEDSADTPSETVKKEFTVTYLDSNGRVIKSETVEEGNAATNSKVPYRPGYDFLGWTVSSGTLKNITCDVTAVAVYEISDVLYTINVTGGTVNGNNTSVKVKYDDCVIVKVDESVIPENKYFVGWKKTGSDKVVSYNKIYSFLVTGSDDVVAVYGDTVSDVLPQTVLFERSVNTEAVIFTCESFIPAGCSYSGSGIIVTKDENIGKSVDLFILNAEGTTSYRANNNSINSQFSVINHNLAEVFYARSYLIYSDANGDKVTVYSDINIYNPEIF
ncbi:MAG: InlB B-repeat-containing protein [Clostridia bacterium]|nr:InlB B-repeat-containing protein [Clostridia bacterium]